MDTNDGQSKTSPSQLPLAANKTSKPRPRHHYLVVQTKRTLLAQKPDEHGMLWGGGQACLNVAVSKATLRRAMGILDSLIRRIEGSGGKAIVTSGSPHRTVITLDGVNLEIQMREGWNQVPHEQTPKDKRFIMNHEYWKVPKWDYTPSGDLLLEVMDYLGTGVRHRWRDGKRRLLSEKPERVLDGLRKAAAALKAVEEERERWQREREERLRKEDEARVQREEEQRRIENLKQLTTNWELARRIREFVTAARQGLVDHHGVLEEGSPLDNWLRRAQGIADRLDPTPEAFRELSPRRLETEAVATLPPLATPPSSSPP